MNARNSAPAECELRIVRVFDAPRKLVFKAWTEREHILRWLAPRGMIVTHAEGDLHPGGHWRSCIRKPDGTELWVGGRYREIVPNEKLVFTHAWDGSDGNPGHETVVTVRFEDLGGKTRMYFHQALFDTVANRDGHHHGWGECFDILAEHLAKVQEHRMRK